MMKQGSLRTVHFYTSALEWAVQAVRIGCAAKDCPGLCSHYLVQVVQAIKQGFAAKPLG